jgi:hypothetical protein
MDLDRFQYQAPYHFRSGLLTVWEMEASKLIHRARSVQAKQNPLVYGSKSMWH